MKKCYLTIAFFHTLNCQENSVFSILYRNLTTSAVIEILDNIKKLNELNGFPTGKDDYIFLRQYKGNIEMCTPRCFDTRLRSYCNKANMDYLKITDEDLDNMGDYFELISVN